MEEITLNIKWKQISILIDNNFTIFATLVDWVFEKQFNIDFLNKFSDFNILKIEDFVENYEFFKS